jgi:hypothetical protein
MPSTPFAYRIGFLGCPVRTMPHWERGWLERLRDLGFNTIQLNVAWGSRPGAEALNLEDLVEVPPDLAGTNPMLGDQAPETRQWRREELRHRIALCRELGLRTVFHFGAPYVGDQFIGDAPANCLLDGRTARRCEGLLHEFARAFPGVDDLLVYTYDQHAWLCSEFGPCPRCTGKPLHQRVVPFLDSLSAIWREHSPSGRLWWEPWELSAGQVLACVQRVNPQGFGLALHCNIAEVMATFPGDRWLRNTVAVAADRGIPAVAEYWLGSPSEELEPFTAIPYPLVTLAGLRLLEGVPGLAGIKEYYGLLPDAPDPNLAVTGLFLGDGGLTDDAALKALAAEYGAAACGLPRFWRLTSRAIELFPWETSWLIRALGRSNPAHSTSAALVRGVPWHTPSWCSTRRSTFMVVDTDDSPDPWLLEDIGLRCGMAAEVLAEALGLGHELAPDVPPALRGHFDTTLAELAEARRRMYAYACHCRETNLCTVLRALREQQAEAPAELVAELLAVLEGDHASQGEASVLAGAIALLRQDLDAFLGAYFQPDPDRLSLGYQSMTSR